MELLEAQRTALAGCGTVVDRIGARDWAAPTPCPEWTVRDLLNHVVYEQLWVPELLAGATVEDVGDRFDGDVLGDDPAGSWRAASAAAGEAWRRPGALDRTVDLSAGPVPAVEYGWHLALDLAVHGWDLAAAIGAGSPLDAGLAEALLDRYADEIPEWHTLGLFAQPLPVEAGAGAPDRLIALLGRDASHPVSR